MSRPQTPKPGELPKELEEAAAWCAWSAGESDRKAPIGSDGLHVDVQGSNPGLTLKEALRVAEEIQGGVGRAGHGADGPKAADIVIATLRGSTRNVGQTRRQ